MRCLTTTEYNERLFEILGVKHVVSVGFGEPGHFQQVTVIMELTDEQRKQIEELQYGTVEACCGDFKNCTKACAPRADYWKEKWMHLKRAFEE